MDFGYKKLANMIIVYNSFTHILEVGLVQVVPPLSRKLYNVSDNGYIPLKDYDQIKRLIWNFSLYITFIFANMYQ